MRRVEFALGVAVLLSACAGELSPDAGVVFTPPDSGVAPPLDAGATEPDAGVPDAGSAEPDAGVAPMTLTAQGTTLTQPDGGPLDFRGAISCCGGAYGWPVFDEAWVDLVVRHKVNFLHARLGPFLTGVEGESDWAAIGGGYVEVNGKADLDRFNEAFFARVRALLGYARARGVYVEVDLADGWAIKHCGNYTGYSAWQPPANVQGEDVCGTAGRGALSPRHTAWVRKVVEETGAFDNVVYQDGNELGLVPGYRPAWTRGLAQVVRAVEAERGYVRHLFGTQAGTGAAMALAEVDFVEQHGDQAATLAECGNKVCLVNEYNPRPPLTPAQLHAEFCAARRQGTYFWYWRHEQSAAQLDATLQLIAQGCPGE